MVTWILVGCLFVLMDAIVVSSVLSLCRQEVGDMLEGFEPVAAEEGAPELRYAGMRVGMMGVDGCMHLRVDSGYLHVSPTGLGRWMGVREASVPWTEIEVEQREADRVEALSRVGRWRRMRAKIRGRDVMLPAWCWRPG